MFKKEIVIASVIFSLCITPKSTQASEKLDPDQALYDQGIAFRNAKKYDQARDCFSAVTLSEDQTLSIKAMHNMGFIADKNKRSKEAYHWFIKANETSLTLKGTSFRPSANNLKKLKEKHPSPDYFKITQEERCSTPLLLEDLTDIIAGLYENKGRSYTVEGAYPLIAWSQGKQEDGTLISAVTPEQNISSLQENKDLPLLSLHDVPCAASTKGYVRFSYRFYPTIIQRPGPVEGYEFHLERPLLPWDTLQIHSSHTSINSNSQLYLTCFYTSSFPLASQCEADYMQAQDGNSAYFSVVRQMEEENRSSENGLQPHSNQDFLALLDNPDLDPRDKTLIRLKYKIIKDNIVEDCQDILRDNTTTPYNFSEAIKTLIYIHIYIHKKPLDSPGNQVLSAIERFLESPKLRAGTRIHSLHTLAFFYNNTEISTHKTHARRLFERILAEPLINNVPYFDTIVSNIYCKLGVLYQSGKGGVKDLKIAGKFFQNAGDLGSVGGALCAGVLLRDGFNGQAPNFHEALRYLKKAANLGSANGANDAGVILWNSEPPKVSEALQYYKLAAELGSADGACNAGFLLSDGWDNPEPNVPEALIYFKKAAYLGSADGAFNAGALLYNGWKGQTPNLQEALIYFEKAEALGHTQAEALIASLRS